MTDLEIHKRCAEAIGLKCYIDADGDVCLEQEDINGDNLQYRPLYDNAQCLELIDRFGLRMSARNCLWTVIAGLTDNKTVKSSGKSTNLNRAVCECVANIAR